MMLWHQPVIDRLAQLQNAQLLPHAIGLVCPPGWGLEILTEQVVRQVLALQSDLSPRDAAHHDLLWVEAEKASITVDQIRALRDFAVQTAQLGERKVAVVYAADKLNVNAANALLKVLEEPPPGTHVLLCTERWSRLLPTVRSRTQRFSVHADWHAASSWLQAQGVVVDDAVIAELGQAPLSITDKSEPEVDRWLQNLSMGTYHQAVAAVAKDAHADWLARWYRLILQRLRLAGDLSGGYHRNLFAFADQLLNARRQLLYTNGANGQLLLEQLSYQWLQIQARPSA